MKYVSIDIETSGLDINTCQILEIGAIVEDCANRLPFDQLPKLKLTIDRQSVSGQPYAINMNARIFRLLAAAQDIDDKDERRKFKVQNGIVSEAEAVDALWNFLYTNGFGERYQVRLPIGDGYMSFEAYAAAMEFAEGDKSRILIPIKSNKKQQIKVNVAGKNFSTFDKRFLEAMPGFTDIIRFRRRILDPSILYTDFIFDAESPSMEKCFSRLGIEHAVAHDAVMDAWDVICLLRPFYQNYGAIMGLVNPQMGESH